MIAPLGGGASYPHFQTREWLLEIALDPAKALLPELPLPEQAVIRR